MGNKQTISTNAKFEANDGQDVIFDERLAKHLGPPVIVLDHLVLGSAYDVNNSELMEQFKVGFVLNVAEECGKVHKHKQVEYMKLVIPDFLDPNEEEKQWQNFEKAFQFIDKAKQAFEKNPDGNRSRCIVHCMRGRSRSASIVIGYLMKRCGMSLLDAYTSVKKNRVAIGPHAHLKKQLVLFETSHLKKLSSLSYPEEWLQIEHELQQGSISKER